MNESKGWTRTDIAVVPKAWDIASIGDLLESSTYGISKRLNTDGVGAAVLRMGNIQNHRLVLSDLKHADVSEDDPEKVFLKRNDILFNRTNSRGLVGKVALVQTDERLSYAGYLLRLRTNDKAHPEWLYQRLAADDMQAVLRSIATPGVSQANINPTRMKSLRIGVPTLSEQRKIAEVLGSVDEAIGATRALIEQTRRVKQGLLQQLLTRGIGHTRFKKTEIGEIPEGWEVVRLGDVADYQNGKAFPSKDYCDIGARLVRPGNLASDEFVVWDDAHTTHLPQSYWRENAGFRVFAGETLMNLTAQSLDDQFLGRVCITPEGTECLLNQRIARIHPRAVDRDFLFWTLKGPHFRQHVDRIPQGSKVQHIYNRDLDSALIALPNESGEQQEIAAVMWSIHHSITTHVNQLNTQTVTKRGLMQDLLTGRVRVKV